ncbi:MAG: LacI family DNA-binding transcriptional regulator [Candidatus Omnitrophica bacterium]|nr:LacI family DNA-binding transcriptional regulator [Candidatus Omnitrophota bacterium]
MTEEKAKKRISIEDVAERAKVSITTVSRVINNVATVSPKNRARVEEAISALKFKPNISAQRLATGVNNSVGLVMPGYPGIFHSFYAIELIRGVGHACEALHLDLVFHITNGFNPLNTNNVGGVIFADIIENRKQVESALSVGTPCMVINNKADDMDVDYIAIDNALGGKIAADYLISLGHKNIAIITGNLSTQAGAFRLAGFKKELEARKIQLAPENIYEGDYSRRSAHSAAEKLFALPNRPTAVFACSDDMALEAMTVAIELGIKIPDELSIVGFDDSPACLYSSIGLTTVKQPLFEMAEQAVKILHQIVNEKHKGRAKEILPPKLIIRESCSAPRS